MSTVSKRQQASKFSWTDTTGKTRALPYWCYVPQQFQEETELPLLLFLHGAGERGTALEPVKKHGPPKLIDEGEDFPFVVISPQCPAGQWWAQRENVLGLEKLLRQVGGGYPIDVTKIYGTGMSMGGYGVWALAAQFPELLAAIIPICGGGDPAKAEAANKTPCWAFHGRLDDVVPPIRSQEMIAAIEKVGGDARLTVYDNVGHDSWTETYVNRDVYDWLLSHANHSGE